MAESVTIHAEPRDPQKNKGTGTRVARRLRAAGRVPAIVYGHKQDPLPISLTRDDVWALIKKSTHLATLRINDATETVLIRDLQWDHLGKEILHLDFARVSADERIDTVVKLTTHGHAPGIAQGGMLEMLYHDLRVSCPANAIPDEIRIDLGSVGLNEGVHVKDLRLPEGVVARAEPDTLLLHVTSRTAATAPTVEAQPAATEPEVIGKKEKEDKDKEK
jgi:large subunit ribosomal protein L25